MTIYYVSWRVSQLRLAIECKDKIRAKYRIDLDFDLDPFDDYHVMVNRSFEMTSIARARANAAGGMLGYTEDDAKMASDRLSRTKPLRKVTALYSSV